MAQSSFPFENIDTTETQYSQLFRTLNNGVNGTPDGGELEVDDATAGLAVDIAAGQAMVRGHFYISTEVETRSLAVADPSNDRIDLVVLRLDPIANSVIIAVKTGTPDAAPVAPALVQTDGGIFEQPLANVLVPANAGVPGTITDRREFMGTKLGSWTTDGRPIPGTRVLFGFNTTLEAVEFYNTITEAWEEITPASINDIGDVTITTPGDGELLAYDDGDWVNQALTAAQLPTGSILQVVTATNQTTFGTTAATFQATGLSATITPSSTSSKILVMVSNNIAHNNSSTACVITIFRGTTAGTNLGNGASGMANIYHDAGGAGTGPAHLSVLDSPSTTSAQVYTCAIQASVAGHEARVQSNNALATMTLLEVAG